MTIRFQQPTTAANLPTIADRYGTKVTAVLFFTVLVSSAALAQRPAIVFVLYTSLLAAALGTGACGANIRGINGILVSFLLFACANMLGNLLFPLSMAPFARMFLVIAALTCGWMYSGLRQGPTRPIISGLAAGSVIVLLFYLSLVTDPKNFEYSRLTGGDENHSNLIGLNCYIMVVALVASGRKWTALILTPPTLWVLSIAQSRTSLGLTGAYLLYMAFLRLLRKDIALAAAAIALMLFGLFVDVAAGQMLYGKSFVLNLLDSIFMFSDQYRGLSTGFVGRSELWAQTFDIFADNPVFGVGLGQHQEYGNMTLPGHSLYLIILAEGGLVGFAAFMFLSAIGLYGLVEARRMTPRASQERRHYDAFVFVICSYFVYGIVEPRGINISNALSFMFFYLIGMGWRYAFVRRASVPMRQRLAAAAPQGPPS